MNLAAVLVTGLFAGGLSCAAMQGGLLTGLITRQRVATAQPTTLGASSDTGAKSAVQTAQQRGWRAQLSDDLAPVGGFLTGKLVSHALLGASLGCPGRCRAPAGGHAHVDADRHRPADHHLGAGPAGYTGLPQHCHRTPGGLDENRAQPGPLSDGAGASTAGVGHCAHSLRGHAVGGGARTDFRVGADRCRHHGGVRGGHQPVVCAAGLRGSQGCHRLARSIGGTDRIDGHRSRALHPSTAPWNWPDRRSQRAGSDTQSDWWHHRPIPPPCPPRTAHRS